MATLNYNRVSDLCLTSKLYMYTLNADHLLTLTRPMYGSNQISEFGTSLIAYTSQQRALNPTELLKQTQLAYKSTNFFTPVSTPIIRYTKRHTVH